MASALPAALMVQGLLTTPARRGPMIVLGALAATALCLAGSGPSWPVVVAGAAALAAAWAALSVADDASWSAPWRAAGPAPLRLVAAVAIAAVPVAFGEVAASALAERPAGNGWWRSLLAQPGLILAVVPGALALLGSRAMGPTATALAIALAFASALAWSGWEDGLLAYVEIAASAAVGVALAFHLPQVHALMVPAGAAVGLLAKGTPDPVAGIALLGLGLAVIAALAANERGRGAAAPAPPAGDALYSDRLGSLGRMGPAIAHELTQPLTALTNFASTARELVALRAQGDSALLAEVVDEIFRQAVRAGQIVRGLRDFARAGDGLRERARLADLLSTGADLAVIGHGDKGISVTIRADERIEVRVYRVQVQQVLFNLVRNALEAMEGRPRRDLRIEAARSVPGWVEIRVTDTGPGLSAEAEAGLFRSARSAKPEGMGLGLMICRDIVEAHGGRLWLENAHPHGATFAFTLPGAEDEDEDG